MRLGEREGVNRNVSITGYHKASVISGPEWTGEELAKHILVHAGQGLGDALHSQILPLLEGPWR